MSFLIEIISDDNGRGSATRASMMIACLIFAACLPFSVAYDQEGISIALITALVGLPGGTYATARLSADSVKKTEIKSNAPQMPNVTVQNAESIDASVTVPSK